MIEEVNQGIRVSEEETAAPRLAPEARLAGHVVRWLESQQWDVFQEVQPYRFRGHVADIVAVRGPVLWIIECKMSFNLQVIAQAMAWKALRRSIAVRQSHASRPDRDHLRQCGREVCRKLEIGVLEVGLAGQVRETEVAPIIRAHRESSHFIRTSLNVGHKHAAKAGSAGGGHWTPYRETMNAVRKIIENSPGLTLDEMLHRLDHHHHRLDASAKMNLGQALRAYEPWCYVDEQVAPARYYLAGQLPEEVAQRCSLFGPDAIAG